MTQHNRMKLRLVASRLHSNDAGRGWYQASYSETSCNFFKVFLIQPTNPKSGNTINGKQRKKGMA